jgi:hypothetical protein
MATGAAPRQDSGGAALRENIDLTATQEARLRAQLDPTQLATTVQTADGAITTTSGLKVISKTSAAAMTLAAPTAGSDDGTQVVITAGTAYAHVVTATGLIHDGVTGGAKSAWTSAAFVGSSIHLIAYNAKWHVVSYNLGTIA